MKRRPGVTLLEVLVAIFVMGIGLLALLVLFPLGALRMAQAIQDERCAQAASMANAIATYQGVRNDPGIFSPPAPFVPITDPFQDPVWSLKKADPNGPSFPVFVDPTGCYNSIGLTETQNWLAGSPLSFETIRRRVVSFTPDSKSALRWFTLLDDVLFGIDGTPSPLSPGIIQRDIRYSWAYMLKRPKTSDRSVVDLTVVVYNKRSLSLSGNLDLNESLYQGAEVKFPLPLATSPPQPSKNTITLDVSPPSVNTLPAVRPGDWLLDATYIADPTNTFATVNGYFYRVVGLTEISPTSIEYEVQPELRNYPATISPGARQKIIFMEGVAEVLEKGTGRVP